MKQLLQITLTISTIIFSTITAFAAPGDLDTTFGGDGRVFSFIGNQSETMVDFAVQTDGKPVGVASIVARDILLVRYNANGTLDSSFGGGISGSHFGEGGKVIVDFGSFEVAKALAIQPDGKIIVAGSSSGIVNDSTQNLSAIMRFNANGSIDSSFGTNGLLLADLETGVESAKDVEVQTDGKILITTGFHIVRYTANGSLDTTFGSNGIISSTATKLEIQTLPQEKISAIGSGIAYRYNLDGSADTSFDGDGILSLQTGIDLAIKLQPDGKILIGGFINSANNGTDEDFALTRFLNNGGVDLTFGSGGFVTTNISSLPINNRISDISLQTDGKIIVTGKVDSTIIDFMTVPVAGIRYNANGSLDTPIFYDPNQSFGVTAGFVEALSDGKILFAGSVFSTFSGLSQAADFSIARFNPDGISLDNNFGIAGIETRELAGLATANEVKFQADGKMLVVGTFFEANEEFPFVARYNSNGSLDSTFDSDGIAVLIATAPNRYHRGSSLAIQPDGKILVTGAVRNSFSGLSDFGLIRFNSDGSLDSSFNDSGFTFTPVGTQNDIPFSIAVQSDGKILVGGAASPLGYALVRFNSNGTLDTTFDIDGKATFGIVNLSANANQPIRISMFLQPDGKIILTGIASDLTVMRVNPNGTLDSSFGTAGIATAPGTETGRAAVLQPDGKIIVTGTAGIPLANPVTAKYNSNGTLDTSFGINGISTITSGLSFFITRSMALQTDGRIILGGESGITTDRPSDFTLIRLLPNGILENSLWGTGGIVTTNMGNNDIVNSVAIQPDGKIIAAGQSGLSIVSLARYQAFAPTAATASINGQVLTASNRGIRNVSLSITDTTTGEIKYGRTNTFGYYRFQDLEVGRIYVLGVSSKRYTFAESSRTITLNEDLTDADFISEGK